MRSKTFVMTVLLVSLFLGAAGASAGARYLWLVKHERVQPFFNVAHLPRRMRPIEVTLGGNEARFIGAPIPDGYIEKWIAERPQFGPVRRIRTHEHGRLQVVYLAYTKRIEK